MGENVVLTMRDVSKTFPGVKALQHVDFTLRKGEIHALMGENGAGKSTLMNILFGMPVIHNTGGFEGTVEVNGEPVQIDTPLKAMEMGDWHGTPGIYADSGIFGDGEH